MLESLTSVGLNSEGVCSNGPKMLFGSILYAWRLCMERNAPRWCSRRSSTCWQIDIRSCSLFDSLRETVMMSSSERIRVPLEIFSIAMRPFPFPSTSCKAYVGFACHALHFLHLFLLFRHPISKASSSIHKPMIRKIEVEYEINCCWIDRVAYRCKLYWDVHGGVT